MQVVVVVAVVVVGGGQVVGACVVWITIQLATTEKRSIFVMLLLTILTDQLIAEPN